MTAATPCNQLHLSKKDSVFRKYEENVRKRYEKNFEIEHLKDTVKCLKKTLWVAIFMAFFLLFLVVKEKVEIMFFSGWAFFMRRGFQVARLVSITERG